MTEKEYETESWVKEILEKASKKAKYQIAREVLEDFYADFPIHLEYAKTLDKIFEWLDQQEEE